MPEPDEPRCLLQPPFPELRLVVEDAAVGDVHVVAVGIPAPGVERADDVVAPDLATVAEVCAVVPAVCVEGDSLPRFAAVEHEVAATEAQRAHLAGPQLARPRGLEP